MKFLVDLVPVQFERYDMKSDVKQVQDIAAERPGLVAKMRGKRLKLHREMVAEGGVWEFSQQSAKQLRNM